MDSEVLVLAPADDPHASAVCWALRQSQVRPLLVPSMRMSDDARVAVWTEANRLRLECSLSATSLKHLRSAWHRRPTRPEAGFCEEADRAFIEGQWHRFQSNVFCIADDLLDALWVNHPEKATRAENKLLQIRVAQEVGLSVPEMVVSNDAKDVQRLLQRWPKVVFKTFYPYNWQSASNGNIYSMSVKLLDGDSELPEAAIAMCPGIYQRYVDKAYDVRVTVIGDRYFGVRMLKNKGEAYVDWRGHMYDDDILIEEWALSEVVECKLRGLMKRLGLVFGCIDLVVDGKGEIYFLEVNQAGQFLFLEEVLPQLPLLKAITNMLASGRVDYSLESGAGCDFAGYRRTDDYAQIVDIQMRQRSAASQYLSVEA
jgi:glutathione synthase/RimK-type ligase-like ATP-grasp enzyme